MLLIPSQSSILHKTQLLVDYSRSYDQQNRERKLNNNQNLSEPGTPGTGFKTPSQDFYWLKADKNRAG